jgi:hypothetical protein
MPEAVEAPARDHPPATGSAAGTPDTALRLIGTNRSAFPICDSSESPTFVYNRRAGFPRIITVHHTLEYFERIQTVTECVDEVRLENIATHNVRVFLVPCVNCSFEPSPAVGLDPDRESCLRK